MKTSKKIRVFISKIHCSKSRLDLNHCYFWYQVNLGTKRVIIKGTLKEVTEKRAALIEKYKSDYIKLGV